MLFTDTDLLQLKTKSMKHLIFLAALVFTASLNAFPQKNYYDCSPIKPYILLEEFNDNKNNWSLSDNSQVLSKIENGKLFYQSKDSNAYANSIVVPLEGPANWEIELKIKYLQGRVNGANGLIWGEEEVLKKNNFWFGFSGDGSYIITRYESTKFIHFVDWTNSALVNKNDFNILTVRKFNSRYYFFINNSFVYEAYYIPLYGNRISIVCSSKTSIIADYLRVYNINDQLRSPLLLISNKNLADKNGNKCIDANEDCSINFSITNTGTGSARNLKALVQTNSSVFGLTFKNSIDIGTIEPNDIRNVSIPISGTMNLTSGKSNINISFEEQMGFPPDPFELNITTKEFAKPNIRIVDYSFLPEKDTIKLGSLIKLKVLVQNIGQGMAENVKVEFQIPEQNVFSNGKRNFELGIMQAGATQELIFEFIPNKLYKDKTIPITVKTSEKYGMFSQNEQVMAEIDSKPQVNSFKPGNGSDVDKNIPQNTVKYPNRYALIIGNEDYSSYQEGLNSEVNVAFAVNDAKIFKEYAINLFGVDEINCLLLTNVTAAKMLQNIEIISKILSRLKEPGELIFYYAGHGFPDEATKIPYLVPVDVNASNLQSAIKLSDLYAKFSQTKAKRITVYLDACFTGGGRNQGLLAARGVKVKPKREMVSGNMVVFAATSKDQSALPYKDKKHGIFTYFLLKKLQETKGDINYGELEKYLSDNVPIESLKINGKPQDPQINVSIDVQNVWETWRIK